jgi:hypothetical protein
VLEVFDPRGIFYVFRVIGDGAGVLARDEFDDAVDEITDVIEEFGVVLCDKLAPEELRVGGFGAGGEEVVTEDGGGLASDPGLVTKDADTTGLGEFVTLVLEVFYALGGLEGREVTCG